MTLIKKRFHPLGGFSLPIALKWLVPLNPIFLFVGVLFLIQDIYAHWDKWMLEKRERPKDYNIRLLLWLSYLLHIIIGYPLDYVLFTGFRHKKIVRLKVWCALNFFNTLWAAVMYWVHTGIFGVHLITLTPYNFYIVFKFYMCVIIYYYSVQLEDEEEMRAAARLLTDAEIKEFEEGLTEGQKAMEIETQNLIDKVQRLRYKREEFEIDLDRLEIDKENPLGNGTYGVVYRGTYHSKQGPLPVAVKTFASGFMDAMCFMALLTELKVMTYLGHHENVLNLVGAVTADIKQRSLLMVLEYCSFGCLLEFLRVSRGLFTNLVVEGEMKSPEEYANMVKNSEINLEDDGLSTLDLIRWMNDIASGMAYLEKMKVVHGDLAARNLLLNENKQIKIADFGLARQLYQYSVYTKRQNAPLPWRWLALESIVDMNFSSKSDVWAFAIVLHELFTLGEVPYIESKQFTLEFIEKLRNGERLKQTNFCPNSIYEVMKQCWNENPDNRPSFQDIQTLLLQITQKSLEPPARERDSSRKLSTTSPKLNEYTPYLTK